MEWFSSFLVPLLTLFATCPFAQAGMQINEGKRKRRVAEFLPELTKCSTADTHDPSIQLMRRAESFPANRDGHFEVHCSSTHGGFGALATENLAAVADEFPGQRLIRLQSLHSTFTPSSLNWAVPSRNLPNQHADLQVLYASTIDDPDRERAQGTLRIRYSVGVGLDYDQGWFGDNENLY
ncbi:hypothetical protein B0J12DRAFT_702070 [Macrophomina phaseolina]|uniref:Uncharacterized protein n=1 Tax=Macrophomina phaseolina TaxID=35725 RepID=A0ABQ8G3M8_9PEZI|nr:hypothetical protein B0J12DRAFT_702070 [Macrophomina phaseolina]